ncbi:unnamed protein product [Phaedon cochleariae]|uniref:Uncharacterized protein n=1 Tax=Phaedon cochleariae TaxID=80249 RepID=A0A9P0DE58_PHACE|nr:unnamed protein product [Phaedon cochleariae]
MVPIDFEVKIAKVPKQKKNANRTNTDEHFIEAVKNLKETIHGSQISLDQKPINSEDKRGEMALLYCQDECTKELNDKLGTMKKYWKKMIGDENEQCRHQENREENGSCKIVEVTTKVEDVKKKFEHQADKVEEKPQSKVQLTKQLFEPKLVIEKTGKISPTIRETCSYFENNTCYETDRSFESLCPTSVEIIDAKNNENEPKKDNKKRKAHKPVSKSNSVSVQPEFDHVRYKLVKSDLFQKKIFANCEKESQFEDLIQYLQDYSFQELLIDNNIVIIEPIRSKVPYKASPCVKSMKNVTPLVHKQDSDSADNKSTLNRPFFYHPIRVNKEVNEDELPNPDTVRQVRQFFEGGSKNKQTNQESDAPKENYKETTTTNIDPDKDRCSAASDSNSHLSNISDLGSQENLYDSLDNEIYCEYVSEAIMEKIREYGTTVTYYGGRVVDQKSGQPVLTKAIMEEIRDNEKRCMDCSNCRKMSNGSVDIEEKDNKNNLKGMKFRLLKSNSCSSRLELVGTDSSQETKKKLLTQQRRIIAQNNLRKKDNVIEECGKKMDQNDRFNEKNAINENIKKQSMNNNSPKIIGEEMKIADNKTQWNDAKNEKSDRTITEKSPTQTIHDFYQYDKVKHITKKMDDMEFEPYEVA